MPSSVRVLFPALPVLALVAGCVAPPAPAPYTPVYVQPPPNYVPPGYSGQRMPVPLLPPAPVEAVPLPTLQPDPDAALPPLLPPEAAPPVDTSPIEMPPLPEPEAKGDAPAPPVAVAPAARPAPASVPMMGFRPMRGQTPVTP